MVDTKVQLRARDLAFSYGTQGGQAAAILHGVSLELREGEMTALFGPNGAGKSTLLRVLGGLLKPSQGDVQVLGTGLETLSASDRARAIARMPQGLDAWPDMRVGDLVWSGRYCHQDVRGWRRFLLSSPSTSKDRKIVDHALSVTGAGAWFERSVRDLSGGERERVLLARSLAQDAPILLADEPTRSLDPAHQLEAFSILRDQARAGRAVLVVTHDWNLASQFADRLICLAAGKLVAEGPPEAVLKPEVLEPIYGKDLYFGNLPNGMPRDPNRGPAAGQSGSSEGETGPPFVLPWLP